MNTPSPDDLDLGQTVRGFSSGQKLFGRYTLRAVLGRGGMGIVWRAFDEELERDVALKFLPELIVHDQSALRELKRETQRSLDLTHPHIVRIYDFVRNEQSACIAMEYVDGQTLSNARAEKQSNAFEVPEIEEYVRQLCDALHYAHTNAQIVHRDLKPANLMLNSRGHLKVTDFGISRSLTDSVSLLTMGRGTSGTLPYMSPQQLDGERASALDDIYSLGATIYELLTSKPPFYSGNLDRQIHEKAAPLITQRRAELEVPGSDIPAEWQAAIAACLAKDPAGRPQSAADVAQRLGLPIASSARAAPPTPLATSPTKSPECNKWQKPALLAVAAALLIAIGGSTAWYFGIHAPAQEQLRRQAETEQREREEQDRQNMLAAEKKQNDEAAEVKRQRLETAELERQRIKTAEQERERAAEAERQRMTAAEVERLRVKAEEERRLAAAPPAPASMPVATPVATPPAAEPAKLFAGTWVGSGTMNLHFNDGTSKTVALRKNRLKINATETGFIDDPGLRLSYFRRDARTLSWGGISSQGVTVKWDHTMVVSNDGETAVWRAKGKYISGSDAGGRSESVWNLKKAK